MKKVHFRITLMMTLLVVVLMILSALVIALPGMQGREYGMNPAATSSGNIQPNPTLNINVTWSTFKHGWSPLEYSNGSANLTLNAQTSTFYPDYISVNPADIQANASLTNNGLGTNKTAWEHYFNLPLSSTPQTFSTKNGAVIDSFNTSTNATENAGIYGVIPISYYPSDNIAYDYLTMIVGFSGKNLAGASATTVFQNGTDSAHSAASATILPNQIQYVSYSLAELAKMNTASYNTSGSGYSGQIAPLLKASVPASSTTYDYTLTIYGMAFTTSPYTLGIQTVNGTAKTPDNFTGNTMQLSTFAPDFSWSSITGNGYSVAVSQPLQNLTTQQSAINTLNYIEQVEYQGQFNLPTAPDLSYGTANLTEHFNVSTSQTQVLDINGVSYLSTISGKNNTILLLSSVNPNGQTQFLQIVDYTQSQWTSISSPPGIFTLAGIEYYWEEFIIAVLAIVGVGAGAASRHASNLRKVK